MILFKDDLKDPESAAHFANAQAESAKELLECGVWQELNETGYSSITVRARVTRKL